MKRLGLSLLVLAAPLALAAQDSSATDVPRTRTLTESWGVHFSIAGGSGPTIGSRSSRGSLSEVRLALTPAAAPAWTLALVSSFTQSEDSTAYVAPNSGGFHPRVQSSAGALELQYRPNKHEALHPIAIVNVGVLTSFYAYYLYPAGRASEYHKEEETATRSATLAGGGEMNVASWLRVAATAGYRKAGGERIRDGVGSNSGTIFALLVQAGKF